MSDDTQVLIVGPRSGLLRELRRRKLRHVVWTERAKRYPGADAVHVAPFARGREGVRREAERLRAHGPFSHVIAGTESAVVAASRARRALGARVSATSVVIRCHDKLAMKAHLVERGIPMTPFVDPAEAGSAEEIVARLGPPLVVKPRTSSGSRDVRFVEGAAALAATPLDGCLVERRVFDATEASVESFVHDGEIRFENVTEYARKAHVNVVPAGLPPDTLRALLALSRDVVRALRIRWGLVHLEAYLTAEGPLFGEVALRPPGGYIMELLHAAWGFDAWRAFVAVELGRPFAFPADCPAHAAALILHPGAGTLRAVRGLEEVRRHPAVVRARLRIQPGEAVPERLGVGTDIGHVILRAPTREALLTAWSEVEALLEIELDA